MRITEKMEAEDEQHWHARNVLIELDYCSKYMVDRKHIRNDDLRFYAFLMRKALELLKEQEPVKAKILKNALTINYKKYAFAGMCPVCNSLLLRHWVACPTCGKAVKWNG